MNIYDIAELAGVSIATVSRVLNDSPNVAEKTKLRVRGIMEEHGYVPSGFSRGLGLNAMKTIGLICPDAADDYMAKVVACLEGSLRNCGYDCILRCSGYSYEDCQIAVSALLRCRVDALVLIGSVYGSVAGFLGGKVDLFMMRIVDIIYTVPDLLIIILLASTLKYPLQSLAEKPGFGWINIIGVPLISILIVFALLYWVGMARIVRSQVLTLKESEYVTAARALGAGTGRIIKKHILTNCIGTLIVTTTLQIPSAIFTESFLSFLGIGVSAPMPSLGSLASTAIDGLQSYPYRLFAPAIAISVVILSFNLFGDGLRDAFDPKLKN